MGELALTEEIKTLGLEKYAEELERDGLTIVPPEVNGFGLDRIDEMVELILARAREMTGCASVSRSTTGVQASCPRRTCPARPQKKWCRTAKTRRCIG